MVLAAKLQGPRMEAAERRMHKSLSEDVEKNGKFGKFSTEGGSKFLCQIGEGGGY